PAFQLGHFGLDFAHARTPLADILLQRVDGSILVARGHPVKLVGQQTRARQDDGDQDAQGQHAFSRTHRIPPPKPNKPGSPSSACRPLARRAPSSSSDDAASFWVYLVGGRFSISTLVMNICRKRNRSMSVFALSSLASCL